MEKRLATALMRGADIISIDNCIRPLNGVFLNQILSQEQVSPRILGVSKDLQLPTNTMVCATGNNLTIAGDMVRRSLLCTIDAGEERPELRRFDGPPLVERVRAARPQLVVACLTILRAWRLARETAGVSVPPYGGFEEWSMWVREALVWLGEADPRETVAAILEMDPEREEIEAVRVGWEQHLGVGVPYKASEVIERAAGPLSLSAPDFRLALMAAAASKGVLSAKELSYWLRSVRGRRVDGYKFEIHRNSKGVRTWKLVKG
jgi:putative DNA primase/helicase